MNCGPVFFLFLSIIIFFVQPPSIGPEKETKEFYSGSIDVRTQEIELPTRVLSSPLKCHVTDVHFIYNILVHIICVDVGH